MIVEVVVLLTIMVLEIGELLYRWKAESSGKAPASFLITRVEQLEEGKKT